MVASRLGPGFDVRVAQVLEELLLATARGELDERGHGMRERRLCQVALGQHAIILRVHGSDDIMVAREQGRLEARADADAQLLLNLCGLLRRVRLLCDWWRLLRLLRLEQPLRTAGRCEIEPRERSRARESAGRGCGDRVGQCDQPRDEHVETALCREADQLRGHVVDRGRHCGLPSLAPLRVERPY
eukprot:jgi/Chrpa1/13831/Chrysochromulina_OHIO_Genome00003333-RA